jgi:hypothetical protein
VLFYNEETYFVTARIPGPGAYDQNYGSIGKTKSGPRLAGRIETKLDSGKVPGPGTYELPTDFSPRSDKGFTLKGRVETPRKCQYNRICN